MTEGAERTTPMAGQLTMRRITAAHELLAAALATPPEGPGFSLADINRAALLEVEGTTIAYPGPDFTRWTLRDPSQAVVATKDIPGF